MTVRTLAVALSLAVASGAAVAMPAHAATGPVVVNEHHYAQPVFDLDSDSSGTVFVTHGDQVRLIRSPMTPGSPEIALGGRGPGSAPYVGQEVSIQDGTVAIPQLTGSGSATTVRWCLVDDCPTTSTLTAPAGYRYLGNAGDVAVLHSATTHALKLQPWAGGAATTISFGSRPVPLGAYGDAGGIVLWHPTSAAYIARPSLTVTTIKGGLAYLTPSYVYFVQYEMTYPYTYVISRVSRATPGAPPVGLSAEEFYREDEVPTRIVATDASVAWAAPFHVTERPPDPAKQTLGLHTLVEEGRHILSATVEWSAVAPLEDTSTFLTHQEGPDGRGFYAVVPGTTTQTLVHELPPVPARVGSISVADDRVAYADDSKPGGAAYVRDVPGGTPGDETLVKVNADQVGLSGPYVAVTKYDSDIGTKSVGGVFTGRIGWRLSTATANEGVPTVSGHRVLVQRPTDVERFSVLRVERYTRAQVTGALFGDYYYAADRYGGIQRRDLRTGALVQVRAGCGNYYCVSDGKKTRLVAWGDDLFYALDLGADGYTAALWDGATGTTTPLPMLAAGWTELSYRDGLLLVHRPGDGVRLYDLTAGTSALVDAGGDLPPGNGIGTSVVAWRNADRQAVVQPITDFFAGRATTPAHINEFVPAGFGPNLIPGNGVWAAEWYVTDSGIPWQLELRQGSASGAVVRTLSGTSEDGTIAPRWNGTDADGDELPHGWYAWTLTTPAGDRSGRVYLSRVAPPMPTLNVPVLTSDQSATDRFTITWDGATGDNRYWLDGPAGTLATTAESRTYTGKGPGTYRFALSIEDPAGRRGPQATGVTVTPYDDSTGTASSSWTRSYAAQHWKGSQLRSSTPGAKIAFSVRADGVWLVGAKGPSYGRYRVTVDDKSWTYDAYSPTVRFRQVLFKLGGLGYRRHAVTVEVLATPGRTRVGVDAIGARLSEDLGH